MGFVSAAKVTLLYWFCWDNSGLKTSRAHFVTKASAANPMGETNGAHIRLYNHQALLTPIRLKETIE